MAKQEFSDEDKTRIVGEYQAAVAAGNGGGKAVAERYGLHSANIIGWSKRRAPRTEASPKVARARRLAPVGPAALTREELNLTNSLNQTVEELIAFHEKRIAYWRGVQQGISA